VLAAVRDLNRVELLAETLRAALNEVAAAAPDWLRALAPPAWFERYGRRIEDMRLPETGPKRDAYVAQVGADGHRLLDTLAGSDAPPVFRRCRRSPCCVGCGRGTSSAPSRDPAAAMPETIAAAHVCGPYRGAVPATGSRPPTTPMPGSGPRAARAGPATWST
jgi:hypothetical protein